MGKFIEGPIHSFEAEEAFAANLVLVKGTGDEQVALPGGANVAGIAGVSGLPGDPADLKRKKVPVTVTGPAKATAAAAIDVGEYVKIAGASGKVTPIGGEGAGTVLNVVGRALTPASGDNDTFTLDVSPFAYQINP